MKRTEENYGDFLKGKSENIPSMEAGELSVLCKFLSRMMTEAFVVLDFRRKNFFYASNHALSLCGHSQEETKALGFDFFKEALHPEYLSFATAVYQIIFESLNNDELEADEVNYFSFLLRVKNAFSSKQKPDYLKIYVKLFPIFTAEQFQYGVCVLYPSVVKEHKKQLCVHYYNMDHSDYSFKRKKWVRYPFSPLSKRQKEMLVWAKQGLTLKETSEIMWVSDKTIENMRYTLFEKFGVNSIEQAIRYASNRRLIYHSPSVQPITEKKNSPPIQSNDMHINDIRDE